MQKCDYFQSKYHYNHADLSFIFYSKQLDCDKDIVNEIYFLNFRCAMIFVSLFREIIN